MPPSSTGLGSQQVASQAEAAWISAGYAEFVAANREWAPTLRQCDPRAVHRSAVGLIAGSRPIMRELLVRLPIPRTFIRGTRGQVLLDRDELEGAGIRIVELSDAGHMVMVDQPDAFAGALAEAFD